MKKPVLIFTGGTLSCIKNDEGRLVPSHAVEALAKDIGFDMSAALRPYTIDSIDFDIGTHYPLLRDAVLKVLGDGDIPIVCGGTDTKIWYSTLLTRDLQRQGKLLPGSGEKVVFLSSMKSLADDSGREHVTKILQAGKDLAEKDLTGGFALAAEDQTARGFVIHNVCEHFDKISSSLPNAFRTEYPVGYLFGKNLYLNELPPTLSVNGSLQSSLHTTSPHGKNSLARIAPPLLDRHDSEAVLAYMKALGSMNPPFDGILIEGLPHQNTLHRNHKRHLVNYVKHLKTRNIRVVFCNPMYFKDEVLHTPENPDSWSKPADQSKAEHGFMEELKLAGAEFVTALPKDAWIDMVLTTPILDHHALPLPEITSRPQPVIGIRYTPNIEVMTAAINALAPETKRLAYSALTHDKMPDALVDAWKRNSGIHHIATFEHNGSRYVMPDGSEITEGEGASPYAAGEGMKGLVQRFPGKGRDIVSILMHRTTRLPFEKLVSATNNDPASAGSSARSL